MEIGKFERARTNARKEDGRHLCFIFLMDEADRCDVFVVIEEPMGGKQMESDPRGLNNMGTKVLFHGG